MINELTFNGKSFSEFSAYIATSNFLDGAAKDIQSVSIVGRFGALQLSNDKFNNLTLKVRMYITNDMQENMRKMRNFLESCWGYCRYEETQTPNEFRMASFKAAFVPEAYDATGAVIDLEFDSMPQRFLKSGELSVPASSTTETTSGNPVSVSNPSGLSAVSSLAVSLNPIQTGTGDPSPTNVRPISGHNYASVGIAGTNLLSTPDTFSNWRMATPTAGNEPVLVQDSPTNYVHFPDVATSTIQQAAICERRIPYFMIRNKTLTFSLDVRVASGASTDLIIQYEVYDNATGGSRTIYTNRDFDIATGTGNWIHLTQTRTFTDDMFINGSGNPNFETCYVRASIWKQHTIGATAGFDIRNPQLEFGSSGTTFVASPSLTETMTPIGQTVYGGSVNLVTGVLTLTHYFVTINGQYPVNKHGSAGFDGYYIFLSSNGLPKCASTQDGTKGQFNMFKTGRLSDGNGCAFVGADTIQFRKDGGGTGNDVKTWLASNPMQVCYPLQTPQTVQLTAQQISLLTGINYISTDGEVTVTATAPTTLENPTLFESKPLIRVYGHGTLAVNNQYITVATNPFPYIDIDCDMMDAFCGANNANQYVSLPNDYITLKSGNNYIAYDGTVEITPRWYEV